MKTAVITGITKGIGLATAKRFLKDGWNVIGTYRGTPAPVDDAALIQLPLDLAVPASIAGTAEKIAVAAPSIDTLVNNAGVLLDGGIDGIDLELVRSTFEVNVFGLIDLTERLVPLMHEGSHVVNLDSGYGSMSDPVDDATSTGYRLSKAALNMYTRTAALRLAPKGIIVSSVAPGWVRTDMGYSIASDTQKPDRTPEDAASDIFTLAVSKPESGGFWEYGKKRPW